MTKKQKKLKKSELIDFYKKHLVSEYPKRGVKWAIRVAWDLVNKCCTNSKGGFEFTGFDQIELELNKIKRSGYIIHGEETEESKKA